MSRTLPLTVTLVSDTVTDDGVTHEEREVELLLVPDEEAQMIRMVPTDPDETVAFPSIAIADLPDLLAGIGADMARRARENREGKA